MSALLILIAAVADRVTLEPKRDAVQDFAACVQRRAPDRAAALLASEPGSETEKRRVGVIAGAYNACIKDRRVLSFQIGLLRGQLAEIAFRNDPAMREKAARLSSRDPVAPDDAKIEAKTASLPADHRETAYAERFRAAFAACIVTANPQAVASLVPTEPGSQQERASLLKAGDTLMRCMPKGVTYHIKAPELRPYLMSSLYYLAANAPTGAQS